MVDVTGPATIGPLRLAGTTPRVPSVPGTTFRLGYTMCLASVRPREVEFDALVVCTGNAGEAKTQSYPEVQGVGVVGDCSAAEADQQSVTNW